MARKIEQEYWIKDKATNEFTKASKKIQGQLNDVEKKSTNVSSSIITSWKKVATVFAGAFVFSKAVEGFKSIVAAASDLEEVTAKFNTVFGNQIEAATRFEQELVQSYNLSTTAARKFLASTQDLLVPLGVAADEAANLSGQVVKLAADLGSINNLDTANVMNDIQSALVGNFETMKKYGVVLNEARVKQKAFDMGLIQSVKGSIDPASKALAAYQLIVEASSSAIGDSERTADSYANTLKRFKASVDDLSAALGQALLPILQPIIADMADWIGLNQDMLAQNFSSFIKTLAGALQFLAENLNIVVAGFIALSGINIALNLASTATNLGAVAAGAKSTGDAISELTKVVGSYNKSWGKFMYVADDVVVAHEATKLSILSLLTNPYFIAAAIAIGLIALAWKDYADNAETATEATDRLNDAIDRTVKSKRLGFINDQIEEYKKKLNDLNKELDFALIDYMEGEATSNVVDILTERIKKYEEILAELNRRKNEIVDAGMPMQPMTSDKILEDNKKAAEELRKLELDRMKILGQSRKFEIESAKDAYNKIIEDKESSDLVIAAAQENLRLKLLEINKRYDQMELDQTFDMLRKKVKAQEEANELLKKEQEKKAKAQEEANELIKKQQEKILEEMRQSGRNFADYLSTEFEDAFTSFLDGTKSASEAFNDLAVSVLRDLSKMLIKMAIFNAMQQYIGSGTAGGILGSVGSFLGFAKGGHTKANEPIIVGEQGPEIFKPDGAGTIIPNGKTNSLMSGNNGEIVAITINVNSSSGSDEESRRQGKIIGDELKSFFDRRLIYQSKPGGILRPQPAMGRRM